MSDPDVSGIAPGSAVSDAAAHSGGVETIDLRYSSGAIVAPTGPVTQILGPSAEQLRAMAEEFSRLARRSDAASSVLAEVRAVLESSRRQIRPMSDFKEAHDLLQEVELAYRPLWDHIHDADRLLAPQQVRWRPLQRGCLELSAKLREIREFLDRALFGDEESCWKEDLDQVAQDLTGSFETRELERFAAAIQVVGEIVSRHLSRMNDQLIGALRTFDLSGLVENLAGLWQSLGPADRPLPPAIEVLRATAIGLAQLRAAHDELQRLDNELRSEETRIWSDLPRFRSNWNNRLIRRLEAARKCLSEPLLATRLGDCGRALQAAIETAVGPEPVVDAFLSLRSETLQSFSRVDHDLRRVCESLRDTDGPLAAILADLQ